MTHFDAPIREGIDDRPAGVGVGPVQLHPKPTADQVEVAGTADVAMQISADDAAGGIDLDGSVDVPADRIHGAAVEDELFAARGGRGLGEAQGCRRG